MKKTFLISILILVSVAIIGGFQHAEDINTKIAPKVMSKSEIELRSSMRVLWESRAILLRAYIVSAINDSKDMGEAKDKLLKNAGDLGGSIKSYYGGFASSFLTGFLKNDVKLTEEVIKAAKSGNKEALDLAGKADKEAMDLAEKARGKTLDITEKAKAKALDLTEKARGKALDLTEKARGKALDLTEKDNKEALDLVKKAKEIALDLVKKAKEIARDLIKKAQKTALDMTERAKKEALDRAKKRWYENANNLAGFFAIPRNQTKKDLTDMLYKHLDLTWGEIEAILAKDGAKDLEYYEKDRAHMVMFSDMLVDGLVKQFPGKFKE